MRRPRPWRPLPGVARGRSRSEGTVRHSRWPLQEKAGGELQAIQVRVVDLRQWRARSKVRAKCRPQAVGHCLERIRVRIQSIRTLLGRTRKVQLLERDLFAARGYQMG